MAKGKINTNKLRTPFYELGDKIIGFEEVSNEINDAKLKKLSKELDNIREQIYLHLQKNYIWD